MITILPSDMVGVVNVTQRHDFLHLHRLAAEIGKDTHAAARDGDLDSHLDGILTGRTAFRREETVVQLRRAVTFDWQPLMEGIAFEMVRDSGLDVITACMIATWLDGPITYLRDGIPLATVNAPEDDYDQVCTAAAHLGSGASINSEGTFTIRDLPASVLVSLGKVRPGTPADDLVSHPLLRRWKVVLGACEVSTTKAVFQATWKRRDLSLDRINDMRSCEIDALIEAMVKR